MAHTICDSHSLGFRKDNLAKWKDGSDDVTGKRNKVSWRKASEMTGQDAHFTHTSPHSQSVHFLMVNNWAHSSQTCVTCHHLQRLDHTTEKNTELVSHTSAVLLIGCRSWAIMLEVLLLLELFFTYHMLPFVLLWEWRNWQDESRIMLES